MAKLPFYMYTKKKDNIIYFRKYYILFLYLKTWVNKQLNKHESN